MAEPQTTSVGISVRMVYDIYQSYQAELSAAIEHFRASRWRDAIGAAQRAWDYYGDAALFFLGIDESARERLRRRGVTGLHDKDARRTYIERTGDRSLASDFQRWRRLTDSVALRHEAEHRGKPVSEAQAGDAIDVRLELMRHVDSVLRATPGVDTRAVDRAAAARDRVAPESEGELRPTRTK